MPAAPTAPSLCAAWRADHAAVRVPDFHAALAWHTETLDFRLNKRWQVRGMTFAWLTQPGENGLFRNFGDRKTRRSRS